MTQTTTKLADQDAVDAFFSSPPPGTRLSAWCYTPNGGWLWGGATGDTSWLTEPDDLLAEFDFNSDSARAWLGEDGKLELASTPERSVHKYATLSWAVDPLQGKRIVACQGAHYGSEWGPSVEDADAYPLAEGLRSGLLAEALAADASACGCEELDDPTDDGCNFSVVDEVKLLRVAKWLAAVESEIIDYEHLQRAAENHVCEILEALAASPEADAWTLLATVGILPAD